MSPPAGDGWPARALRMGWRLAHPRSFAGLFLRLAVAMSAAILAADALGLFGG